MALIAGLSEFDGRLPFAAGFWLPVAVVLIVMVVAIFAVHRKNGYWVTQNGIEYQIILIALAIGVALIGPGVYVL